MAINQYIVGATCTVPAGTAATVVAGEPGTAGAAGYGSKATTGGPIWAITYYQGQLIALDPTGADYTAINTAGGSLRQVTPAQETGGNWGTFN